MADSLRQTLVSAIKTRMQTITTANGYETNIGNAVWNWKTGIWTIAEFEAGGIDIRDGKERIETSSTGLTREDHHLTVDFVIMVGTGATTGVTVRKAIADVYKAIGTDRKWGLTFVQTTWPVEVDMLVDQDEKIVGGAQIEIEVIYRSNLFNPYA